MPRGTTVLGAQQPIAGDPAALLSQFGLKHRVALACLAQEAIDRAAAAGVARSVKSLPAIAVDHIQRSTSSPYATAQRPRERTLLQQIAVVKEGGKRLAPAPRRGGEAR